MEDSKRLWFTDLISIGASLVYFLALIRLAFIPGQIWPALILGIGIVAICCIVIALTKNLAPQKVNVVRPQAEVWFVLIWFAFVLILALMTYKNGVELVNQFTNWFFLVLVPIIVLSLVRRRKSTLRETLHSAGVVRKGVAQSLKLGLATSILSLPLLYFVGEQQRESIRMMLQKPTGAIGSFIISFLFALLTISFVEEFYFRGLLQSRLAIGMRSEWKGLVVASLLFGIFHLPMYLYSQYEPTQGDLFWSISSVIAEQAVAGMLFGILWMRTRSLVAPMLVHAFMDALAMMTTLIINIG